MVEITVTDFARSLRTVFDRIEHTGEEVILVRNKHKIARILPGSPCLRARDVMGDLYRTLPDDAAIDWLKDSRIEGAGTEIRDPWVS